MNALSYSREPPLQDSMFIMIFRILHILNLLFGADNFMYTYMSASEVTVWTDRLTDKLKWQLWGTYPQSVWRKRVRKSGKYREALCMLQSACSFQPFLIHFSSCSIIQQLLTMVSVYLTCLIFAVGLKMINKKHERRSLEASITEQKPQI